MEYVLGVPRIFVLCCVPDDRSFSLIIRPDVRFFCDLDFDPFLLMQDKGKVYGTTFQLLDAR